MRAWNVLLGTLLAAALAGGCRTAPGREAAATHATIRFEEAAAGAGLRWTHQPCPTGKKLLPETMGGGGGFLDYNRDGWQDVLLLNGAPLPGYRGPAPRHALYRNNGDGTFTEATREAGLDQSGYAMGAASGDFDGDGWTDLFLTGVGFNRLLHNRSGRFLDVTGAAGVRVPGWGTGAAWVDFDRDGRPDLFVAEYVAWSPAEHVPCGSPSNPQYCPPFEYRSGKPWLFRNVGGGRFQDISTTSGIRGHSGKTLGVLPCDVNRDGWPDLFLTNDTEPDVLLLNNGKGGFEESGLAAGVSLGADGRATGSMGVDGAVPFNDRREALVVGNFVGQGTSLFVSAAAEAASTPLFDNLKSAAGLADSTLPSSTFGTLFEDVDLDGWTDLLLLNGHLDENLAVSHAREPYRQLPQLFHNRRDGTFAEVGRRAGFTEPLVGRGLAVGDVDNDGRRDFLALENGGRVRLWRNRTEVSYSWLGLQLEGSRGPRDGSGARVTLQAGSGEQTRYVTTCRSYLSINDPRVVFGVAGRQPVEVTVDWPGGGTVLYRIPETGRYYRIREDSKEPEPLPVKSPTSAAR